MGAACLLLLAAPDGDAGGGGGPKAATDRLAACGDTALRRTVQLCVAAAAPPAHPAHGIRPSALMPSKAPRAGFPFPL